MKDYWKFRFPLRKYETGESYWLSGDVRKIQKKDDGWHALLHGTYEYDVDIVSDGETVREMTCSCPNARNGGYCKHMAAVLFELTYPELTADAPENLNTDQKNKYRLEAYERIPAGDSKVSDMRYSLSWLEDDYSDEEDEISWESGGDYAESFLHEMKRIIEPMIESGEYLKAFEGLKQACFVLETAELNGSLGEHSRITHRIQKYWGRIISLSSPEEKDIMFDWLRGLNLYDVYSYVDKEAEETLLTAFPENRYRNILLNDAWKKLKDEGIGGDMFEHYLGKYKKLLEHSGMKTDICDELLEEHLRFSDTLKAGMKQ